MRGASLGVWGVLVLGMAMPAATAEACGELPDGQYGLAGSQPLDAAVDVPRDAVLAFAVTCRSDENPALEWAVCQNYRSLLEVTLLPTSGDGSAIVGTTEAFGDSQVWVPPAPLLANETYMVEVRLVPEAVPFPDATQSLSFSFTTGDALLPALSSEGVVQQAEYYDAPVAVCGERRLVGDTAAGVLDPNAICPFTSEPCEAAGTERVPRLTVRFRALDGGARELGYDVRMMVTDVVPGNFESLPGGGQDTQWADAPHDLLLGRASHVAAGSAGELTLDLLRPEREDGDETVCVRALFFDAGGRITSPKPVCKDYDEWLSDAEKLQEDEEAGRPNAPKADAGTGSPDAGVASHTADSSDSTRRDADAAADSVESGAGCAAHGAGAGMLGWLLALSLGVLARRRLPL